MTNNQNVPPHICPHCLERMLTSGKPVQWSPEHRGYEHIACAASVPHAA